MQAVGQFSRELRQRIGVPLKQVAFSGGRLEIHQSFPKYLLRSLVTYADLKTAPGKDAAVYQARSSPAHFDTFDSPDKS
jgi:hypothetical protein